MLRNPGKPERPSGSPRLLRTEHKCQLAVYPHYVQCQSISVPRLPAFDPWNMKGTMHCSQEQSTPVSVVGTITVHRIACAIPSERALAASTCGTPSQYSAIQRQYFVAAQSVNRAAGRARACLGYMLKVRRNPTCIMYLAQSNSPSRYIKGRFALRLHPSFTRSFRLSR